MNIIEMGTIQKQVNEEMAEGYRSALRLIAREAITAADDLNARTDTPLQGARMMAEGANIEDLFVLCHDMGRAADSLTKLSEALKAVFVETYSQQEYDKLVPDEAKANRWMHEVIEDRYMRKESIINTMTSEYQARVNCIIENGIKSQLFRKKK